MPYKLNPFTGKFDYYQGSSVTGIPVVGEDLSSGGTLSGTTFTLAHTPIAGTVALFRGGARQQVTGDYTISGAVITLNVALVVGEILLVDYYY